MNKWIRFYNQNRGKVFLTIIVIIFILVMVSLFNNVYKQKSKEESEKIAEEANDVEKNKYRNESKSLVSGGEVSGTKKNDFGDLIETFLSYCKNHEPAKAYGLLSNDCKNVLYPDEFIFEEQYYKTKFSTSKRYSFQSWTSSDSYIYLVKIFDDMLATGTGSSQNYIQDYFSVIEEDGQYRLNINGFVGKVEINKTGSKDNVTITVKDRIVYMDYSVYTISIKNDRQSTVLLDSRKKTDTTYIVDENNVKFESLLYENRDEDLKVASGETKQLQIKFSDSYREKIGIKQMVFEDVYLDDNFVYFGSNNGKIEVNLKE